MRQRGPSTQLIHVGEDRRPVASLTTPVYETTTFVFETAADVRRYQEGQSGTYLYSRYENPTVVAAEEKVAALDGAERALIFASGMAATATALLAFVKAGDEIVCSAAIYGGTFHLLADLFARLGVRPRFVTLEELAEPERIIGDRTRIVWFESPVNPTLRCVDIRRVASACRARAVLSIIDNTFATPINQLPLAMGIDLAMQSATKYLNGHSDVTGGALAGPRALIDHVCRTRRLLGTVIDPQAAYALARGLKTLPLRMQRHNATAMSIARFLQDHPRVNEVFYPGLPSHPDHRQAGEQMTGFGGMICFDVGRLEDAARLFDRLKLIKRAASLGGVESLASLPVLTSHWGHSEDDLRRAGVTAGMVRLSVGLEEVDDLTADLDQALAVATSQVAAG